MTNIYRNLSESYRSIYEGPGEFGQTPRSIEKADQYLDKNPSARKDMKKKGGRFFNDRQTRIMDRNPEPGERTNQIINKALQDPLRGGAEKQDVEILKRKLQSNDKSDKDYHQEYMDKRHMFDYEGMMKPAQKEAASRMKSMNKDKLYGGKFEDLYNNIKDKFTDLDIQGMFDGNNEIPDSLDDAIRSIGKDPDSMNYREYDKYMSDIIDTYKIMNKPDWIQNALQANKDHQQSNIDADNDLMDKIEEYTKKEAKGLNKKFKKGEFEYYFDELTDKIKNGGMQSVLDDLEDRRMSLGQYAGGGHNLDDHHPIGAYLQDASYQLDMDKFNDDYYKRNFYTDLMNDFDPDDVDEEDLANMYRKFGDIAPRSALPYNDYSRRKHLSDGLPDHMREKIGQQIMKRFAHHFDNPEPEKEITSEEYTKCISEAYYKMYNK